MNRREKMTVTLTRMEWEAIARALLIAARRPRLGASAAEWAMECGELVGVRETLLKQVKL